MENSSLPSASQWFLIPRNVHSVKRQVLSSISAYVTQHRIWHSITRVVGLYLPEVFMFVQPVQHVVCDGVLPHHVVL